MRGWALAQPHPNWENTPPSPPSCLSPPGVSPPHTSTPSSYTASPQPHRPGTASQSRSQNKVCPASVRPPSWRASYHAAGSPPEVFSDTAVPAAPPTTPSPLSPTHSGPSSPLPASTSS
ncbi:hypothetical protein SERLADRAFT_442799 [Serpula lacrymans var. lacrymans S7.9]|uniref:Uncharacterized protein n=1 Tax=Serpula lacrymans var. lacrymans (strain S7.9) TaxID=578457 RepID=F8P9Z3_SERL9|nr:uncharacterized protein SERLADRAFT_442799 [Serpula lacrymans var. lacrymans S7.9]EGO19991.1 hypothetical protein SERLADRAFT_442799 [Serpula lacrymans var. lacrymans S7.9]